MEFYAIGYRFEEDVYFDLEKMEDVHGLEPTCFLPTKELAKQIIEDELSVDYIPVKIELLSLSEKGIWTHGREIVEDWDE